MTGDVVLNEKIADSFLSLAVSSDYANEHSKSCRFEFTPVISPDYFDATGEIRRVT